MGRYDGQHLCKVYYISSLGLTGHETYFTDSETPALIQHKANYPNSKIIRIERKDRNRWIKKYWTIF